MAPPLGIRWMEDLIGRIPLCMFTILQIRKRTKKKPAGKTNQQGQENGYQMTKGPDLHHAQQSLTHAITMSKLTFVELCIRWVKLCLALVGCFCL